MIFTPRCDSSLKQGLALNITGDLYLRTDFERSNERTLLALY